MTAMNLIRRGALASLLLAGLGLAGCASTPAPTLLTLPSVSVPITAPAPAAPVLALARLDVPEYLVSRRVRYRTDNSTLAEWPDTYWAERIEVGMSREFVASLRARLPAWRVCDANCAELGPAAALRVVLDRVDYQRGERMLRASVRIIVSSADRAPRAIADQERVYEIAAASDGPQAQARAYADLLSRVATDAAALVPAPPAGVPASAAPLR